MTSQRTAIRMITTRTAGITIPSTTNAAAVPMWSTIQPKFIPKNPVMKVSGRKITVIRLIGADVAGVVTAVGGSVTRLTPGDEVYGIGKGTFAEYARVLERKLAPKPANLTFEQAAVVPISGLTALQAVRDQGEVRADQRVLITGASGGVGSYAVQLAKAFGGHVTAVCSAGKADFVRSLGADDVLDYRQDDFADSGPYDVIVDINGNATLRRLRRALAPKGTAVITGGENGGRWLGGLTLGCGRRRGARWSSPSSSGRVRIADGC